MNLRDLRAANIARNSIWDPKDKITIDFFLNELGGELGEAMNVLKKMDRILLGLRGTTATAEQLAEELADIAIVLDLSAMRKGYDVLMSVGWRPFDRLTPSQMGVELFKSIAYAIEEPIMDNFDTAFDVIGSVAKAFGIDLMEAIPKKFNATSVKYQLPIFIGFPPAEARLHPDVP